MFDVGALLQEVRQQLLAMVSPPAPLPSNLRFGSVEARALQVRREFYRLFHAEHLLWDTSDERAARVAYSRLWDTFRHGYNNRASNRAEARRHVAHRSFCNALTLLSDEVRFDQSWVGLLCWAEDAVSQYVCHYCDAELFASVNTVLIPSQGRDRPSRTMGVLQSSRYRLAASCSSTLPSAVGFLRDPAAGKAGDPGAESRSRQGIWRMPQRGVPLLLRKLLPK